MIRRARPRNSSPARARSDRAAHHLRGRRRQAVDLRLPGRRPGELRRRCATVSPTRIQLAERSFERGAARPSRSARRRRCSTRSTAVFAAGRARDGVRRRRATSTHLPSRARIAGRVELWPLVAAEKVESRRRLRLPRRRRGAPTPPHQRLARLIAAHRRGMIGTRAPRAQGRAAPRRRHHGAGAPAQRLRRRAGARAEAARASRSPASTAWCSPSSSRSGPAGAGALRAAAAGRSQPRRACCKSPLVGLDEDELFTLAWNRSTASLAARCASAAARAGLRRGARAAVALAGARRLRDAVRLLRPGAGRRRRPPRGCSRGSATRPPTRSTSCWRARWPTSAAEAASLQGFLRWFDAGRRRDQARPRGQPPAARCAS